MVAVSLKKKKEYNKKYYEKNKEKVKANPDTDNLASLHAREHASTSGRLG